MRSPGVFATYAVAVVPLLVFAACTSDSGDPAGTVAPSATPTAVSSTPALIELSGVRARIFHTATLLNDGSVLLAGGYDGETLIAKADIFDPVSRTAAIGPNLNVLRQSHTAVLLESGEVLIAGGVAFGGASAALASAEIFDPSLSTLTLVGELAFARIAPHSVLLPDGRVLIVGGTSLDRTFVTEFEVYDPGKSAFLTAGTLPHALGTVNGLILLPDGAVLAVGGAAAAIIRPGRDWEVELVDLSGPEWPSASMSVLIGDYEVLLVGRGRTDAAALGELFVYNVEMNTLLSVGSLAASRAQATVTRLADGRVLIAGGIEEYGEPLRRSSAIEIYSPDTGKFGEMAELPAQVARLTATLLADGSVLFIGIGSYGGSDDVAVMYQPPQPQ